MNNEKTEDEKYIEELKIKLRNSYKYKAAIEWVDFLENSFDKITKTYKKLIKKR